MKSKKFKEKKEPKFSEVKNEQPSVRVLSDDELPESHSIVKIEKMDMPLATVDEAKSMWKQYQDLMAALMKESDIVEIQGKKKIKKSGVNKIARFFGYSVEVLRTKKEEITGPQGGRQFVWYAWVKAIAPNGRFRVEGAACSSMERRFAHLHHDVLATSITRASNRAIQDLAGMGELELTEDDNNEEIPEQNTETKPKTYQSKPNEESENSNELGQEKTKKWAIDEREDKSTATIYKPKPKQEQGIKNTTITNPKLPASQKQIDFINALIGKLRDDYEVETELEKPVEELNKGEAANLIEKLLDRGKEAKKKRTEKVSSKTEIEEPQYDGSIYGKQNI